MKELVVISGKGGSGKTSVVASFAAMADRAVVADCDVDAADLHLVLNPTILERHDFTAGYEMQLDPQRCIGCMKCRDVCRFDAIALDGPGNELIEKTCTIDEIACEGCGACMPVCPRDAITSTPGVCGQWFISTTRFGCLVHARLGIARENSGKLVSLVRQKAKEQCRAAGAALILVDGPPGVGCPVIASVGGADCVLVVAEPTVSGRHDLMRVLRLTSHFRVPTAVAINKWDISREVTLQLEEEMQAAGVPVLGRIRYDEAVTQAQVNRQCLVEFSQTAAAIDVRTLWGAVGEWIQQPGPLFSVVTKDGGAMRD